LYAEVLPHVEALRAATSVLSSENEVPRGQLRITAPNDLGTLLLAEIVARFVQRYPEVSVDVVLTSQTVDLVAEGIDLAVRAGVLRDSSLVAKKVADAELQLYASPTYLAQRGTPRVLADLATHDTVLFRAKNGRARWTLECKSERASVDVRGSLAADDFAFLLAATVGGAGIALLPRFTAEADLRAGKLVRVLATHAARSAGAIYVVHASSKHVPRKVAAFRDFLVESLRAMPPL
jgi:DNA-binding transcriptional LysR family regulator